jgi:hypothetical protein
MAHGWYFDRLLLQPTQFIPAIDGALSQLVSSIHVVGKHDIAGKECSSNPALFLCDGKLNLSVYDSSCGIQGIIWSAARQP